MVQLPCWVPPVLVLRLGFVPSSFEYTTGRASKCAHGLVLTRQQSAHVGCSSGALVPVFFALKTRLSWKSGSGLDVSTGVGFLSGSGFCWEECLLGKVSVRESASQGKCLSEKDGSLSAMQATCANGHVDGTGALLRRRAASVQADGRCQWRSGGTCRFPLGASPRGWPFPGGPPSALRARGSCPQAGA